MDFLLLIFKGLLTLILLISCFAIAVIGYEGRFGWFLIGLGVILSVGHYVVIEWFGFVMFGNPGLTLLIWYLLSILFILVNEEETTVTRHDHKE